MTVTYSETAEAAKARGAFYTPLAITRFLAAWAIRDSTDWVLEPSAGDGGFLVAIGDRLNELPSNGPRGGVLAIEREPEEAQKAQRLAPAANVLISDFFDLDPVSTRTFAAVVGNPPYIRYHGFRGVDRDKALSRAEAQGVELTGLASSWAHFVVHATAFLEKSGRLALVLPAELLHADYASPIRELLRRRFSSVTVVAFDKAAFPSAQVDAVLLLASNDQPNGFRVIRVDDITGLATLDLTDVPMVRQAPSRWSGSVDREAGDVYQLALDSGRGVRLGHWAHVDIGFVSGANAFFVMTRERAAELNLPASVLTAAVERPSDVPGVLLRQDETRLLLDLAGKTDIDDATGRYLASGIRQGLDQRYKTRSRSPWYAVPLPRRMPDAFIPYMLHRGPRLIVNTHGARNSNLLHGVALKQNAPRIVAMAVAMASSMTLLSAEIEGRAYGGGVLKLETKEAERLLVPKIESMGSLAELLPTVDKALRLGDVRAAARIVDATLDLPHDDLWDAYERMRTRRLSRARSVGR